MVRESNCRDGEPNPPSERRLLSLRGASPCARWTDTPPSATPRPKKLTPSEPYGGSSREPSSGEPHQGNLRAHPAPRRRKEARDCPSIGVGMWCARNLFLHACRVQSPADLVFGPCATVPARGDRGRSTRPAVRAGRHPAPARPSPHCLAAPARRRALPHPLEKDYGGFHPAISWDRERNSWRIFTPLTLPSPRRGEGAADSYSFRGP